MLLLTLLLAGGRYCCSSYCIHQVSASLLFRVGKNYNRHTLACATLFVLRFTISVSTIAQTRSPRLAHTRRQNVKTQRYKDTEPIQNLSYSLSPSVPLSRHLQPLKVCPEIFYRPWLSPLLFESPFELLEYPSLNDTLIDLPICSQLLGNEPFECFCRTETRNEESDESPCIFEIPRVER